MKRMCVCDVCVCVCKRMVGSLHRWWIENKNIFFFFLDRAWFSSPREGTRTRGRFAVSAMLRAHLQRHKRFQLACWTD